MFGCAIHLNGWSLLVALALVLMWISAGLLSLWNVLLVLKPSRRGWFRWLNLGMVLGYVGWEVMLCCGVFNNVFFVMVSALLVPISVSSILGF